MLDDKATAGMYILPFVETENVASENHERVACRYAGFDLPRREGAEGRHGEREGEVIETQVEGGLDAEGGSTNEGAKHMPALGG